MFSSDHAIWKFAYNGDELDDWLPYAEDLVRKWSVQNSKEISFKGTFDIILAALLLQDDLLPVSARVAFSELMLEAIVEAGANKLRIECLHIVPSKPGRKGNPREIYVRCKEVEQLIQSGLTSNAAYQEIAEKHNRSPDTIRRDFERRFLGAVKRKRTGGK